ncbi:GyrI-like domain-containing protein [Rhodoplanes sp. SY1]|uniref:GyrI-like domain-containing protein n=1 Tax=Rhodoplanes sp. SY1 TaxID=3166646 RepID=UPI0038B696D9
MRPRRFVATLAAIAAAVLWQSSLGVAQGQGGTPASPPAASPPAVPAPTAPAPSTSAPSTQAPAAPAQAAPGTPPAAGQAGEVFGEDVTMQARTIVQVSGKASWDRAFEAIQDALKTVSAYLQKQNLTPSGPATTIYTSTDDNGFTFRAGYPVAQAPSPAPTGDLAVGQTPAGKALKYVHRGSYDSMDATYEAITNQLDDKNLDAQDQFVEVYVTDPLTTPEDKLVIEVFVPLR